MTEKIEIYKGYIDCPIWGKQEESNCPYCAEYAGMTDEKAEILCDCEKRW
jgi:hypothetical protein